MARIAGRGDTRGRRVGQGQLETANPLAGEGRTAGQLDEYHVGTDNDSIPGLQRVSPFLGGAMKTFGRGGLVLACAALTLAVCPAGENRGDKKVDTRVFEMR